MKGVSTLVEYTAEFESSFEQAEFQVEFIRQFLKENNIHISPEQYFIIDYAVRELLNNAVEHGNHLDIQKKVKYCLHCNEDKFELDVYDQGSGFDLDCILSDDHHLDILRQRNRGLSSILLAGFNLQVDKGHVHACISVL